MQAKCRACRAPVHRCTQAAIHVSVCPLPVIAHSEKQKVQSLTWNQNPTVDGTKVLIASQHCKHSRRQTLQCHSPPLSLFPLSFLQKRFQLT